VAKLHDKRKGKSYAAAAPDLLIAIETFLTTCRSPAVLEEGDSPIALAPGSYTLEVRAGRLCVEASTESRLLSRRITSVDQHRPGILDCTFQRFGGAEGKITFLDLDRPQTAHRQLTANRRNFGEQFRRMLSRQFPQWEIEALSSSMDLRRSFSPVFPRAVLTRGGEVIAAIACPTPGHETEFLTFVLLWFDHVLGSHPDTRLSLCLFLPEKSGCLTAHRLRWLRSNVLRPRIFLFNEHGSAGEVDPQDLGNLQTRVGSRYVQPELAASVQGMIHRLLDLPHVSAVDELSGAVSIRFKGAEFVRIENGRVRLGLTSQHDVSDSEFESIHAFALQLLELENTAPSLPERWLEGAVRSNLQTIDASLLPTLIHGQVLTFAGRDRDAVDLLGVSISGRLTVLELKASEDLHLPLQGLDYWMRIKWHLERAELSHLFPSVSLDPQAPRLLLIAPALSFHSANATVLRYFSPEVEVERIGVNSDWETHLRVIMRLIGADTPISHGRFS
jgi:hypothetical protein